MSSNILGGAPGRVPCIFLALYYFWSCSDLAVLVFESWVLPDYYVVPELSLQFVNLFSARAYSLSFASPNAETWVGLPAPFEAAFTRC